jgi:hypothetical protein
MSSTDIAVRDTVVLPSLDELAGTVEREHAAVTDALRAALTHALAAGDALLQAQDELRDVPSFERWIEARGFGYRTAQKYMRLASYRDRLEAHPDYGDLTANPATLYLRGLPKRTREDEEQSALNDEITRLHADGVGSREISRMLGCHLSTVRYHTDPAYREAKIRREATRVSGLRVQARETETVRRLEIRGGHLQEAHVALAGVEESLEQAKAKAQNGDERRDIQLALDSLTTAKHYLARAVRSDLDRNHRTKVKHADTLDAEEAA